MSNFVIITNDDRGWVLQGPTWNDVGVYPGGAISVNDNSWGNVKGRYRE